MSVCVCVEWRGERGKGEAGTMPQKKEFRLLLPKYDQPRLFLLLIRTHTLSLVDDVFDAHRRNTRDKANDDGGMWCGSVAPDA